MKRGQSGKLKPLYTDQLHPPNPPFSVLLEDGEGESKAASLKEKREDVVLVLAVVFLSK